MSNETIIASANNKQKEVFYIQLLQKIFPQLNIAKIFPNATQQQIESTIKQYFQKLNIQNIDPQHILTVIYIRYIEQQIKIYFEKMVQWYNSLLRKYHLELNFDISQFLKDNNSQTIQQLVEKDSKILIFDKYLQEDFFDFKIICYIFPSSSQDILNYKQINDVNQRLIFVFRLLQRHEIPIIVPQQYIYQKQAVSNLEEVLMRYMFIWQHILIYQSASDQVINQVVQLNQQTYQQNKQEEHLQYMDIDDFIKRSSKYYEERQISSIFDGNKTQSNQGSIVNDSQRNIFIAKRQTVPIIKHAHQEIKLQEETKPVKQLQTSEVQTDIKQETEDRQTQTDIQQVQQLYNEPQISVVEENMTQEDYDSIQEQASQIYGKINQQHTSMPERYSTVKMFDDLDISNIQYIQMTNMQDDNEDEGFFKGLQNDIKDNEEDTIQVHQAIAQIKDPNVKSFAIDPDIVQKQQQEQNLYIKNCKFTTYNGKNVNIPIDMSIYFNPQQKYLRVQFFQNKVEVLHFNTEQVVKVQRNIDKNNLKFLLVNQNIVNIHIQQNNDFNSAVEIFSRANKII